MEIPEPGGLSKSSLDEFLLGADAAEMIAGEEKPKANQSFVGVRRNHGG